MGITVNDEYPDLTAFIDVIDETGITAELLNKMIERHSGNREHTKKLYARYKTRMDGVPIFLREPRFKHEDESIEEINNKLNNDFFSEIVDIKTGFFAGKPASYSYSTTEESEDDTGGENEVDEAAKALSDFVTRNNMYDLNMEMTKLAAICGYAGRLFYIDTDGNERAMVVPPYETIILSRKDMTEPVYAVRYFSVYDIDGKETYKAEFYDSTSIYYYAGDIGSMTEEKEPQEHMFDYCPLQGIPNNRELIGDAEKVLSLIDAYDRTTSDNSNDIEGNTNAHMVFQNVNIDDVTMAKARKSGAFRFNGIAESKIYYLTKDVNDTFNNNHLNRLEDNIYRFSKTPNLNDDSFGTASGIALKFRITGLESKCGSFEAKCVSADNYMFKLLGSIFQKKKIPFEYLQCYVKYKRNFPMDIASEAQTAQALIGAKLPQEVVYEQLSFIDDVDYVMKLIEDEKNGITPLETPVDNEPDKQGTEE